MAETAPIPEGYEVAGNPEEQRFIPKDADYSSERFAMPLGARVVVMGGLSFITVAIAGVVQRYGQAATIFRAENAHRLPRSERNWFFYSRAKSLYAMSAGLQRGPVRGFKYMWLPMTLVLIENAVDHARGYESKDIFSTVTATMSLAGIYSLWARQGILEASRFLRISFKLGLLYGLAQDGMGYYSGRRLFYVDYLKKIWGTSEADQEVSEL